MQEENIPRHRRVLSQNYPYERHTHGGGPVNVGYLFDHERKKSLRNQKQSEFDKLVKKIDEKLATNRAKRSRSKGSRAGSRGGSRAGSRKCSVSKKTSNGNLFRVQGKTLAGIHQDGDKQLLRREYPLRSKSKGLGKQNLSRRDSVTSLHSQNIPVQRQTYTHRFFKPLDQNQHQKVEVNVKVEVNTKPEFLKPPMKREDYNNGQFTDRNLN